MDNKMSIYVWTLGEIALARLSKRVYAKVKIVKNEEGLFHDEKILGINYDKDNNLELTEELCYYVEIIRTNHRMWLPYTSLHLAERSRPFYGSEKAIQTNYRRNKENICMENKNISVPKKRKLKEEHILPLQVKLTNREPDLNTSYDIRHMPLKQGKYENAFQEFVRRGKEMLFDYFYFLIESDDNLNVDILDYLKNVDASTEDKFEMVIKNLVSEKEIENYLRQCWRYNFVYKQTSQMEAVKDGDKSNTTSPTKLAVTVHINWCLVCGQKDRLKECPNCPSAFHMACRREWLTTIIHRKNPPKRPQKATTLVKKILSSTRTICSVHKEKENTELCPSCMWGPRVGYEDVVWHKLGSCGWWPARVVAPGATPSCLLSRGHSPHHWPLRYYGTENYSWGESVRMCLFLPSHAAELQPRDPMLQEAVLDAADDYISVYLT